MDSGSWGKMLNTRRKRSGGGCLQWEVMRIITAALLAAACAACWLTSRTAESHPARQQHPIRKTSPSSSTPEPAPTSSTRAQLGTTPFSSYTSPVDGLGGLSFSPLAVGDGWTAFVHSLYSPREPKERDISWISQLTVPTAARLLFSSTGFRCSCLHADAVFRCVDASCGYGCCR